MSKTPFEKSQNSDDELLVEYRFDYQKAKPNRFATGSEKQRTVVVIEDPPSKKAFPGGTWERG